MRWTQGAHKLCTHLAIKLHPRIFDPIRVSADPVRVLAYCIVVASPTVQRPRRAREGVLAPVIGRNDAAVGMKNNTHMEKL